MTISDIKRWVRDHWIWILFPVGLFILIKSWGKKEIIVQEPPKMSEVVHSIKQVTDKKEEQLSMLEDKFRSDIQKLTEEQKQEYERVKSLPLEAVADWIDQL